MLWRAAVSCCALEDVLVKSLYVMLWLNAILCYVVHRRA